MNKIDTLIAYLFAIQAFAKDIHYSASGEAFYSKHLLADEIYKGIDEQIDALIETCILPFAPAKRIDEYWEQAKIIIPDERTFENLRLVFADILSYMDSNSGNFDRAQQSLIDGVMQDLQRKLGLITRQVG